MAKVVFDLEETQLKFSNKICQNNSFQQNFSKVKSGNNYDKGNKAMSICSDQMSGCYFILQTSTFLLINAAAVTVGQGHG